jgi:hypothetical protein
MTSSRSRFETVHLASQSGVKSAALRKFMETRSGQLARQCLYEAPGATHCAQPLGMQSAIECLELRFEGFIDQSRCVEDLFVAVENFVDVGTDGAYYDRCVVAARYVVSDTSFWYTELAVSSIQIRVPDEFAPTDLPDIQEPLGYSTTVGSRVHAKFPEHPSDDWARAVDSSNPDRSTQICDALAQLKFH